MKVRAQPACLLQQIESVGCCGFSRHQRDGDQPLLAGRDSQAVAADLRAAILASLNVRSGVAYRITNSPQETFVWTRRKL